MFICTHCGNLVEEPHVIRERHGSPYGFEEYYAFCSCGGEFEEAVECEECGEYVAKGDAHLTDDGLRICQECKNTAQEPEFLVKLAV